MEAPQAGSVTRHVRAAIRTIGLRGDGDFDVSTIGPDTDLEALGVDSLIVGDLHARLKQAFGLTLEMRAYATLRTPRALSDALLELHHARGGDASTSTSSSTAPPAEGTASATQEEDAPAASYSEALWAKGVDGVLDKAYKDAWSLVGY